jgi:ABC-2 type transport system ATP-binding protein
LTDGPFLWPSARVLLPVEPATGLDVAGRRSLLESVPEVVHDPERSVVVSSHMLADVERVADWLLVLNGGTVIKDGATDSLVGE